MGDVLLIRIIILTKTYKEMRAFLFKVTFVSGLTMFQSGIGYNIDDALMDACATMAQAGDLNEDDVEDVRLVTDGGQHHA